MTTIVWLALEINKIYDVLYHMYCYIILYFVTETTTESNRTIQLVHIIRVVQSVTRMLNARIDKYDTFSSIMY